ncbi:MAG: type II toxin-antitoxin system YafQ family toxin [Oscillospiraceae bacterium]|nr:type II toxin-antitoxin system YafQ family toxin [Oscillospiraceae bacterium]
MKYSIEVTSRFKRDYKKVKKRGCDMELLKNIVIALANGEKLPNENRDHELKGDHRGYRECHIQPDWLLIYKFEDDILILTLSETGTHSDLFK